HMQRGNRTEAGSRQRQPDFNASSRMLRSGDGNQNAEFGTAPRLPLMLAAGDSDRDRAFKSRDDFGDLLVWLNPDDKETVTFPRLAGHRLFGRLLLHPGDNIDTGSADTRLCALDLGRSSCLFNDRFERCTRTLTALHR